MAHRCGCGPNLAPNCLRAGSREPGSPADIYPELADFANALNERQLDAPLVLRDHAQVMSFFDGLDLVEPCVVQLSKWHPQTEVEAAAAAALWGGVARKPA